MSRNVALASSTRDTELGWVSSFEIVIVAMPIVGEEGDEGDEASGLNPESESSFGLTRCSQVLTKRFSSMVSELIR